MGPTEHPLAKGSEDGMSEEEEECGEQETIDVSKLRAELRERALEDEVGPFKKSLGMLVPHQIL